MASVKVHDKQAKANMKLRLRRAEDFRPILRWARDEIQRANRANFSSQGAASGKPWLPLDDEYARWKLTHAGPAPLLVFSGKLMQSLTSLRGSPNEIDKTSAVFGTNVSYARFHQTGTSKMPERKIMFVPPLFAHTLARQAGEHILHGTISGASGAGSLLKRLF